VTEAKRGELTQNIQSLTMLKEAEAPRVFERHGNEGEVPLEYVGERGSQI